MLMVGMEGSAVLAVRKVVVVARAAEREVAEGAGAGSARVACVDGGSAGCACVLRRHLAAAAASSSTSCSRIPATVLLCTDRVSFAKTLQRCELAVNNLGWKPTRRSPKRAEDVVLDVRTTLSRSTT